MKKNRRGFIASLIGPEKAEPGELLELARETDRRAAILARSGADPTSEKGKTLWRSLFDHRKALVTSEPLSDLDCLVLVFSARQALHALRKLPLDDEHVGQRGYWIDEADTALQSMQGLFETTVGHTVDDLGFSLRGGTSMN